MLLNFFNSFFNFCNRDQYPREITYQFSIFNFIDPSFQILFNYYFTFNFFLRINFSTTFLFYSHNSLFYIHSCFIYTIFSIKYISPPHPLFSFLPFLQIIHFHFHSHSSFLFLSSSSLLSYHFHISCSASFKFYHPISQTVISSILTSLLPSFSQILFHSTLSPHFFTISFLSFTLLNYRPSLILPIN